VPVSVHSFLSENSSSGYSELSSSMPTNPEDDPWVAHLEHCYLNRDKGANAVDPEDLRTLMLRRLVIVFGVDSDYVNSLMPLLIQQFAIDYARNGKTKMCFQSLDENFIELSDPRFHAKLKKMRRGRGKDPYAIPGV